MVLLVLWGVDAVSLGAQNAEFSMFVASTLAPSGTIERSGGTPEHRRETLRSRLGFLSISGGFRDRISKVLGCSWNTKCVFCYACLKVTLCNDFGVCFWMSGAPESSIWREMCCQKKSEFHTCWDSVTFSIVFHVSS